MDRAYILDLECSGLLANNNDNPDANNTERNNTKLASWLLGITRRLAGNCGLRATDIHDIVAADVRAAGPGPTAAPSLLESLNQGRFPGGRLTAYGAHRGTASGLQALSLAAMSVLSGQQDVIAAMGGSLRQSAAGPPGLDASQDPDQAGEQSYQVQVTASAVAALESGQLAHYGLTTSASALGIADRVKNESPVRSPVAAAGVAFVVNERFSSRFPGTPKALIRRFATAAGYDGSTEDAMKEAIIRVLMNETLNVTDVDLWEIYDASPATPVAVAERLGINLAQVNVAGGCVTYGEAGAATSIRSVATALCALSARQLRRCVLTVPGPGRTGTAMLIERKL